MPKSLYIAVAKDGEQKVCQLRCSAELAFSDYCPLTGALVRYVPPRTILEVAAVRRLRPRKHTPLTDLPSILKQRYSGKKIMLARKMRG